MATSLKSRKILTYSVFGAVLFVLYLLEYSPKVNLSVFSVEFSLVVPAVFASAILFREWAGAFYGLTVGLALDAVTSRTVCFNTITLFVLCLLAGLCMSRFFLSNKVAVAALMISVNLVYSILKWLCLFVLAGEPQSLRYFFSVILPTFAVNTALGFVMWLVFRMIAKKLAKK